MGDTFVRVAISNKLNSQIDDMIKKIKSNFGITITRIEASKIIDWKSRSFKVTLSAKKLLEILGDNRNE